MAAEPRKPNLAPTAAYNPANLTPGDRQPADVVAREGARAEQSAGRRDQVKRRPRGRGELLRRQRARSGIPVAVGNTPEIGGGRD